MSKENGLQKIKDDYTSRSVRFPLIMDELENLLGQVLTIVDAAYTNPAQNKATKDLIRQRFGNKMHDVFWQYCYANDFDADGAGAWYSSNIVEGTMKYSDTDKINRPPRGHDMPAVE